MQELVGPVKECSISYNQNGQSKGIGQIVFKRRGDGYKAQMELNGRTVDNS